MMWTSLGHPIWPLVWRIIGSVEPKVVGAQTYKVRTAMTLGQDPRAQGDNQEDPGQGTGQMKTQGRSKESWEQSKSSNSHTVDSRESLERFPEKIISSATQSPVGFPVPLLDEETGSQCKWLVTGHRKPSLLPSVPSHTMDLGGKGPQQRW